MVVMEQEFPGLKPYKTPLERFTHEYRSVCEVVRNERPWGVYIGLPEVKFRRT